MTKEELAKELLKAARAEAARQDFDAQVERIAAAVRAKLKHIHASDDDDLVCPSCGYKGPEADFEPDDEESDGYSTDDETSETGGDDNVEKLDAAGKKRVVAELLARKRRRY